MSTLIFVNTPRFGRKPSGTRKERVVNSPNYRNGSFRNIEETPQITSDRGYAGIMMDFLFGEKRQVRPDRRIPTTKTDLHLLNPKEDVMVWFGHSSYFLQVNGKRMLVDPIFSNAGSPLPFYNRSFEGTNLYQVSDVPDIDYLFISHDHWDHLDYASMKALRKRVRKVVCGLGVGEHFERWKFTPEQLVELDWNENAMLDEDVTVYCLPARHFSGRGFSPNQTLWASFLIQFPLSKIYLGGDSGYGSHFKTIGKLFNGVDLAILENGQYDPDWKFIHMAPEETAQASVDLNARRLITVHHSRFALSKHAWNDPLERIAKAADKVGVDLITPIIGEKINLNDSTLVTKRWWE